MTMVNTDRIQATYSGNLASVVFDETVKNGVVFHLGAMASNVLNADGEEDGEVFEAVKPNTADTTFSGDNKAVLLHHSPERSYDPRKNSIEDFELESGKIGRGYFLTEGDLFTMTEDMITGTKAVGNYVVPQDGSFKLNAVSSKGSTQFVGRIVEQSNLGFKGETAYTIVVEQV